MHSWNTYNRLANTEQLAGQSIRLDQAIAFAAAPWWTQGNAVSVLATFSAPPLSRPKDGARK
jgi:hypothetical protein